MKYGFMKIAMISPELEVGTPKVNAKLMLDALKGIKAQMAIFPELSLTGYSCGDLFFTQGLIQESKEALSSFLEANPFKGIVILGAPVLVGNHLYNCAIVIQRDVILGIVPKSYLPNKGPFTEKRWFNSFSDMSVISYIQPDIPFGSLIFEEESYDFRFGVELCYDMFAPITPGSILAVNGANVIVNIASSNEEYGKKRKQMVLASSQKNCGAYIYVSSGLYESTSEMIFAGHHLVAVNGNLVKENEMFQTETDITYATIDIERINHSRQLNNGLQDSKETGNVETVYFSLEEETIELEKLDQTPFVPKEDIYESFKVISLILEMSLYRRIKHLKAKTIIIGVSGGLDSTLALLVAHRAFLRLKKDPKDIIAVTMPGLATSSRTKNNALDLMKKLGVTLKEIDIKDAVLDHFKLISHDEKKQDITYENAQARMRTMILMDMANDLQGFVLGTGDMSEIALGWCTYNGDQMSMYGINSGLPKTLIRFMVTEYAKNGYQDLSDTLMDIVNTPISPELKENQETEQFVGKYEVNDFIMYCFLSGGDAPQKIIYLLAQAFKMSNEEAAKAVDNFFNRFYHQQYKRQASPDGPRVLGVSLDARGGFKMPSDIK